MSFELQQMLTHALGFLIFALFVFPNGVTGPGGIDKQRLINLWTDIKKMLGITQEDTAS